MTKNIFGQIEHNDGIKVIGKQSRKQVFFTRVLGPTDEELSDPDAVQETFVQQRGFASNDQGETGDVRELQRKGVLEEPISKPKEVSERGDATSAGSAFYDE